MAIDWDKRAEEYICILRASSLQSATELLAHYLRSAEIDGALNVLEEMRKRNDPDVVIQ